MNNDPTIVQNKSLTPTVGEDVLTTCFGIPIPDSKSKIFDALTKARNERRQSTKRKNRIANKKYEGYLKELSKKPSRETVKKAKSILKKEFRKETDQQKRYQIFQQIINLPIVGYPK